MRKDGWWLAAELINTVFFQHLKFVSVKTKKNFYFFIFDHAMNYMRRVKYSKAERKTTTSTSSYIIMYAVVEMNYWNHCHINLAILLPRGIASFIFTIHSRSFARHSLLCACAAVCHHRFSAHIQIQSVFRWARASFLPRLLLVFMPLLIVAPYCQWN